MDDIEAILPGPSSRTVIFDNQYHVSEDVWQGEDRGPLEVFCGSRLMKSWKLSDEQKDLLQMMGFGIFANTHVVLQNDTSLITALIERWRPETNTFFLRRGEMTVTLEDVGYILGLPVFGDPVVGVAMSSPKDSFLKNWFEPLTEDEVNLGWGRGGIKFTWLHERYGGLPGDDPVRIAIHTQAYLMLVLGSVLFPTTSRNVVHPRYIQPLLQPDTVHRFSWGSAVLAYLYRGLEHGARRGSSRVYGCLWLLMIWAYERFNIGRPVPDPLRDSYPVAEYWATGPPIVVIGEDGQEERVVLGKRRLSSRGPHHSLPHYRAELDGVGSDIVEWTPYDEFEEVREEDMDIDDITTLVHLDWEEIDARLGGMARVPLICFDIVEFQHADRVVRQFGFRPCIPRAPVDMSEYRKEKQTFVPVDWIAVWFAEIGHWDRFCERPSSALVDDSDHVSEEVYMAWYSDIARMRVGKPHAVPRTDYGSRELYPNLEGYQLIQACLDFVKKIDARLPLGEAEFREIAPTFLDPYCSFMKSLKGPAYRPPVFEHIDLGEKNMEGDALLAEHDIVDMTQPSQHVSQTEPEAVPSSSRTSKLQLRTFKKGKWKINKPLGLDKKNKIYDDWGWGLDKKVKLEGGISHPYYQLSHNIMLSMAPGCWTDDRIVYGYMTLLRDREEGIAAENIWERKPSYYFMDPLFMSVAKRNLKIPTTTEALKRFYCDWACSDIGPPINQVDYIFVPACVNENHWVLFIFAVRVWGVMLLDPLYDDPHYPEEEHIMVSLIPTMLRYCGRNLKSYPEDEAGFQVWEKRPKQSNSSDCAIYIMKYMDYILQGFEIGSTPWTTQDTETFRYRIALELQKGKARRIPGFLMRQRLENASKASSGS